MNLKIETYNNIVLVESDSPQDIFQNSEAINDRLEKDAAVLIVNIGGTFSLPEDNVIRENIQEYFKNIDALTIGMKSDFSEVSFDGMTLFDIRTGNTAYSLGHDIKLSDEQLKKYEIMCGRKEAQRYKDFLEKKSDDLFATGLVKVMETESELKDSVTDYAQRLLKEKSPFQIKALISCFMYARTGDTELVMREESCQFYKLIKEKSEAGINGTE